MVVVVSGVAGSGKTTIGKMLAERWNVPYAEGDDFHPEVNRLRMAEGKPLSDVDRGPWLDAICSWTKERLAAGEGGVITCSALKLRYRRQLERPGLRLVFLKVDLATVEKRIDMRQGHFFPPELARSQFETLEEPEPGEDVLVVDASRPQDEVVSQILEGLAAG